MAKVLELQLRHHSNEYLGLISFRIDFWEVLKRDLLLSFKEDISAEAFVKHGELEITYLGNALKVQSFHTLTFDESF